MSSISAANTAPDTPEKNASRRKKHRQSQARYFLGEVILWSFLFMVIAGDFYMQPAARHAPHLTPSSFPALQLARKKSITVKADDKGHFSVRAAINGQDVILMVDTGATVVALTYKDARQLGLTKGLTFTGYSQTANGRSRIAMIELPEIRIGKIVIKNVRAVVAKPGSLQTSLLGMSFISRLSSFHLGGNTLTLAK